MPFGWQSGLAQLSSFYRREPWLGWPHTENLFYAIGATLMLFDIRTAYGDAKISYTKTMPKGAGGPHAATARSAATNCFCPP